MFWLLPTFFYLGLIRTENEKLSRRQTGLTWSYVKHFVQATTRIKKNEYVNVFSKSNDQEQLYN